MRRMLRVNITVPVYNEEAALPVSIPRLNQFLNGVSGFDCKSVIADNASTDRTYEVACAARLWDCGKHCRSGLGKSLPGGTGSNPER